jgi:hypothetical protein
VIFSQTHPVTLFQILQRTESELRLAEQAFDQFLQENDRKAVAAMKR